MKKQAIFKLIEALIPIIVGVLVFGYFQGWYTQTKNISVLSLSKDFENGRIVSVTEIQRNKPLFNSSNIVVSVSFTNNGDTTTFNDTAKIYAYQNGVELGTSYISGYDSNTKYRDIKQGANVVVKFGFKLIDENAPVEISIANRYGQDPTSGTFSLK